MNACKYKSFLYLVPKKDIELLKLYIEYLFLLAKRDGQDKTITVKRYDVIYKAIMKQWPKNNLLGKIQTIFIKKNMSLSLLLEPIEGFSWLAKNNYPLTLIKATPILMQIIAPLARFIAVLNNQKPPCYHPLSNLLFSYVAIYLFMNEENKDILKKYNLVSSKENLMSIEKLSLKEATEVIAVSKGFIFKNKMAFYVALCRALINKQIKYQKDSLSFFNYVNVILYALWYRISIKDKTKGLNKI